MSYRFALFITLLCLLISTCKKEPDDVTPVPIGELQLVQARIGAIPLKTSALTEDMATDQAIFISFSKPVATANIDNAIRLEGENGETLDLTFSFLDDNKTVSAKPTEELDENVTYELVLTDALKSADGGSFAGAMFSFRTLFTPLSLTVLSVDGKDLLAGGRVTGVPLDFRLQLTFSYPVKIEDLRRQLKIESAGGETIDLQVENGSGDGLSFTVTSPDTLEHLHPHTLLITDDLVSADGRSFEEIERVFYTQLDETPKFPIISDEELLTLVQRQTFKYFWDFGHPVSGLARERNTSGNLVTSGGSGFGLMAIIVGVERGFISRQQAIGRLTTIIDFLAEADRFHGAWSHWLNGGTGDVIPFSANDNGGDLVETSFLVMGLLTVRQYLDPDDSEEQALIDKINDLWESVEWDWYTRGGQKVLYWHWSPNLGWIMNHPIQGYNEAAITYILAASSPTHPITPDVYHQGWARSGQMVNGQEFYGIRLPLGPNFGGPLFFEHYTYLGIDPRKLKDAYADYWEQVVNHTLINREHSIRNPSGFVGYSDKSWGLTASDNHQGYSAHSPSNDLGVLTPTAALSSMPYTPEYSLAAMKHFYYSLGDKLWGEYGFYDAFNPTVGWVAGSYLAIDQGPIIGMIENYRTGLLWDLFMSCPEVQAGLTALGYMY